MTRIRCDGLGGKDAHSQPRSRDSRAEPPRQPLPSRCARTSLHALVEAFGGPAVPVHRRPPGARGPGRVRRCGPGRRRGHHPAARQGSPGEQRFGLLEARGELAACEILADAARRHGALLAVNDRADIARAAGADVLHPGAGRPATGGGPRHRRANDADRPVHPRDRRGVPGADGGRRLLLRRPCAGPPRPSRADRHPGWSWCVRWRGCGPTSRGSRSAVSTSGGWPRCSTPGPAGSWWSGRSPPPRIRARPPAAQCGAGCCRLISARHQAKTPLVISTVCGNGCRQSSWSSGLRVLVMRRLSQLSANPGAAATRSPRPRPPSATPNSPGWARCPAGGRVGHHGRRSRPPAGPETSAVTTVARTCTTSAGRPASSWACAPRPVRLSRGCRGHPRQRPGPALMAPRGAVLQQDRGCSVGLGRAQQQSGRAVPAPVRRAGGIPPSRRRRLARVQDKHATRRFVGRSCPIRHSCS